MKSILALILLGISSMAFGGQGASDRPKITGIDHVVLYTTAPEGVTHLYQVVLGLPVTKPLEPGEVMRYTVGKQWVGYMAAPDPQAVERMDHIAFTTADVAALKSYLESKGVTVPETITSWPDGSRSFRMKDPEGHTIEFVERAKGEPPAKPLAEAISHRLTHAAFIIRNRGIEDAFYRDILGFRVYWTGWREAGHPEWCAMQVTDGTDWLEYMLNAPAQPDLWQGGTTYHISLSVESIPQTVVKLKSHGWRPSVAEHQGMGLDGKLQLQLFDPDLTRVELMEFAPVQKPCCTDFQGPHPEPDR